MSEDKIYAGYGLFNAAIENVGAKVLERISHHAMRAKDIRGFGRAMFFEECLPALSAPLRSGGDLSHLPESVVARAIQNAMQMGLLTHGTLQEELRWYFGTKQCVETGSFDGWEERIVCREEAQDFFRILSGGNSDE